MTEIKTLIERARELDAKATKTRLSWEDYKNPIRRFISGLTISPSGCWVWRGAKTGTGYGTITVERKTIGCHKFSYEKFRKPVAAGLVLDHICRNTLCANPWHLREVTSKENILIGVGVCAVNRRKTRCLRGHVFTDSNTYFKYGKWRVCRTCKRTQDRMEALEEPKL